MSTEPCKVEKCKSVFNGITGNIETSVEVIHLDHFEPLRPEEKTSIGLFIESKLLEVKRGCLKNEKNGSLQHQKSPNLTPSWYSA